MPVLKILDTAEDDFAQRLDSLLRRNILAEAGIEESVRDIVGTCPARGRFRSTEIDAGVRPGGYYQCGRA